VAVGGTTLRSDVAGNFRSEAGWGFGRYSFFFGGSGGGVSAFEAKPSYQAGVTQSASKRTSPDVAYNADPGTGYVVYDSWDGGWYAVGGTSAGAPQWAALIAIADQGRAAAGEPALSGASQTLPALYSLPATDFHDIVTGSNGYTAQAGYDLVSGRGSPRANLVIQDLVNLGKAVAPSSTSGTSNLLHILSISPAARANPVAIVSTSGTDALNAIDATSISNVQTPSVASRVDPAIIQASLTLTHQVTAPATLPATAQVTTSATVLPPLPTPDAAFQGPRANARNLSGGGDADLAPFDEEDSSGEGQEVMAAPQVTPDARQVAADALTPTATPFAALDSTFRSEKTIALLRAELTIPVLPQGAQEATPASAAALVGLVLTLGCHRPVGSGERAANRPKPVWPPRRQ
jgi:hypothetical protein